MSADIRLARYGELVELARIYEHAAPDVCPVPSRAALERALAAGELFVLAQGNELLGCMRLDRVEPPEYARVPWKYAAGPGRALVMHALYIPPEHARRGHGTRLMRFALARARELDCDAVRLDAWGSAAAALALYESLGFRTAARVAVLRDNAPDEQVFLERGVGHAGAMDAHGASEGYTGMAERQRGGRGSMNAAISRRAALALAAAAPAIACGCAADGTSQLASTTASGSSGTAVIADSAAAAAEDPTSEPQGQTTAETLLGTMSLEQKVAQLFVCTPEQLTGVGVATQAGAATAEALQEIPVGGLVYFAQNITGAQQLRDMLADTRALCQEAGAGIAPFLAVDEEGGTLVARVAKSGYFDVPVFPNMAEVGATGDPTQAAEVGSGIGGYLADIGFNVDFAPVADVLTNPDNTAIGARSFGSDPELVADMVAAEVEAMAATGTIPCAKHFPGHGDTAGDSHSGAVYSERTREQIESCEYLPFSAAIEAGAPMVMMGHIETPELAGDGLPASLSRVMMTEELRGALGFEGLIIADSMSMGAITESYDAAEAAVMFLQGGGDLVLMPESLRDAYDGVLAAVETGELSEERIDESVLRILEAKEAAGILV